jgi:hypothetical protein
VAGGARDWSLPTVWMDNVWCSLGLRLLFTIVWACGPCVDPARFSLFSIPLKISV